MSLIIFIDVKLLNRMYLVISFDFCGTSDVKIHTLTHDKEKAVDVYNDVFKLLKLDTSNADESYQLQLIKVKEDFVCKKGVTLFWGGEGTKNNVQNILNFNDRDD